MHIPCIPFEIALMGLLNEGLILVYIPFYIVLMELLPLNDGHKCTVKKILIQMLILPLFIVLLLPFLTFCTCCSSNY